MLASIVFLPFFYDANNEQAQQNACLRVAFAFFFLVAVILFAVVLAMLYQLLYLLLIDLVSSSSSYSGEAYVGTL